MRRLTIWLAVALLAGCAGGDDGRSVGNSAATAPPIAPAGGRGALVLHGGAGGGWALADLVLDHAGERPTLCLIETAAGDLGGSESLFRGREGVRLEVLDLSQADAQRAETVARLRACSGYFFNGGDPQRLSDAFLSYGSDTPALAAIRERFAQQGALVSGSSAGAMIVGPVTLCECGPRSSLVALQEGELFQAPGFSFLDGVLIDAHFFERGLLGRHMVALARNRVPVGIGIDEATAVIVPGDGGAWSIAGSGAVAIVAAPPGVTPGRLHDFRFSILLPGDSFDPLRHRYRIAADRLPVTLAARPDVPPPWTEDIFAPGGVRALAEALVASEAAEAVGLADGESIRVTFRKTPQTRAFGDDRGYSILDLAVDIDG